MRLRNGAVLAILVLFKEDRRLRLEPQAFKKMRLWYPRANLYVILFQGTRSQQWNSSRR
jgi:hypothetical protein